MKLTYWSSEQCEYWLKNSPNFENPYLNRWMLFDSNTMQGALLPVRPTKKQLRKFKSNRGCK